MLEGTLMATGKEVMIALNIKNYNYSHCMYIIIICIIHVIYIDSLSLTCNCDVVPSCIQSVGSVTTGLRVWTRLTMLR